MNTFESTTWHGLCHSRIRPGQESVELPDPNVLPEPCVETAAHTPFRSFFGLYDDIFDPDCLDCEWDENKSSINDHIDYYTNEPSTPRSTTLANVKYTSHLVSSSISSDATIRRSLSPAASSSYHDYGHFEDVLSANRGSSSRSKQTACNTNYTNSHSGKQLLGSTFEAKRNSGLPRSAAYAQKPSAAYSATHKNYPCLIKGCRHMSKNVCVRDRHRETHYPPRFMCPLSSLTPDTGRCSGHDGGPSMFIRGDALIRHLKIKHPGIRCKDPQDYAIRQPGWIVDPTELDAE